MVTVSPLTTATTATQPSLARVSYCFWRISSSTHRKAKLEAPYLLIWLLGGLLYTTDSKLSVTAATILPCLLLSRGRVHRRDLITSPHCVFECQTGLGERVPDLGFIDVSQCRRKQIGCHRKA